MSVLSFVQGYGRGQEDVLLALEGTDHVHWVLDESVRGSYALWCLGHNLAVAGGLAQSRRDGIAEHATVVFEETVRNLKAGDWHQLELRF